MGIFIEKNQLIRHFPNNEDSLIRTVGYDNFCVVKPLFAQRVQNFYTWHFVISGAGVLKIGNNKFMIQQGQMFFIPPGEKFRYYPDPAAPWEYVWFSLTGSLAGQYGSLLGFSTQKPVRNCLVFPAVVSRLKKLFASLMSDGGSVFGALAAFYAIMDLCMVDALPTRIFAVKQHIDESFALPGFSVEQLCYDAGISHAHMSRLFKKEYGVSVIQYVISKRIELACDLLLTTDLSVKSVAFSCGFRDEPHFMKTFKRHKGVTALQFRKNGP